MVDTELLPAADQEFADVINLLEAEPSSSTADSSLVPRLGNLIASTPDLTFLLFVSSWPCLYQQANPKRPSECN